VKLIIDKTKTQGKHNIVLLIEGWNAEVREQQAIAKEK